MSDITSYSALLYFAVYYGVRRRNAVAESEQSNDSATSTATHERGRMARTGTNEPRREA